MTAIPRLSIGLPVFNGENYLAESIEALGQSYEDFELIISTTPRRTEPQKFAIAMKTGLAHSLLSQPRNIGCALNHNFVIRQARGQLFKTASHDDLYART
jgi:glycosyltransferase involved in cell wall biosynthesis